MLDITDRSSDIQLTIQVGERTAVPARLLLQVLDSVEAALYESDRDDIKKAVAALGLKDIIRDAALERVRAYRNRRFLLEGASSGSVILIGVVGAVSLFVLEKTLGEAFAEGFKQTDCCKDLEAFFKNQIDNKYHFIAEAIRRAAASRKLAADVLTGDPPSRATGRADVRVNVRGYLPGINSDGMFEIPSLARSLDKQ